MQQQSSCSNEEDVTVAGVGGGESQAPGLRLAIFVKRDLQALVAANFLVPVARAVHGWAVLLLVCDFVMERERASADLREHLALERDIFFDGIEAAYEAGGMQRQSRPLASGLPLPQPSGDDNARFLTFRQLADCYSCDICYVGNKARSANSPDCQAKLRAFMPDFALNLRNNMIYSHELISIPKVAFLNLHSGRLPAYRGLYALWRAMCEGDKEAACVLHLIDDGIDTGQILQHSFVKVDYSRSFLGNSVRLYIAGVKSVLSRLTSYLVTGTLDGPLVAPASGEPGNTSNTSRSSENTVCGLGGSAPLDGRAASTIPPCSSVSRYYTVPTVEEIREHSHVSLSRAEDLLEVLTAAKKCATSVLFDTVSATVDAGTDYSNDVAKRVTVIVLPDKTQPTQYNAKPQAES